MSCLVLSCIVLSGFGLGLGLGSVVTAERMHPFANPPSNLQSHRLGLGLGRVRIRVRFKVRG